jgi:hypothetical protein
MAVPCARDTFERLLADGGSSSQMAGHMGLILKVRYDAEEPQPAQERGTDNEREG